MSLWAIAYDLDVKGMKAAGYTKSNVTQFYDKIRGCLASHNFERMKQWSLYTSEKANSLTDAFAVCMDLQQVPDANRFVKRLHLLRVEDFNDLLPLITGAPSAEEDAIEREIEEEFGADGQEPVTELIPT